MLRLYYSPVSTYSHKVLMALYEKDVAFAKVIVDFSDAKSIEQHRRTPPLGQGPGARSR